MKLQETKFDECIMSLNQMIYSCTYRVSELRLVTIISFYNISFSIHEILLIYANHLIAMRDLIIICQYLIG